MTREPFVNITKVFQLQQEKIVSLIKAIIEPDCIYLLSASLKRRETASIFQTDTTVVNEEADYFIVVLIPNLRSRPQHEWQDMIEQQCNKIAYTTAIVLESDTFKKWIRNNHPFACHVGITAPLIYGGFNEEQIVFNDFDDELAEKTNKKIYQVGLKKAQEFMLGAELYSIRNQLKLAAFMLHQGAEHALSTLIKSGTGYYQTTHNLDKLIRYASLVSYQIPDLFPRRTEMEKKQFSVLQKAYVDARYDDNYSVSHYDLDFLFEKIKKMIEIVANYERDLPVITHPR